MTTYQTQMLIMLSFAGFWTTLGVFFGDENMRAHYHTRAAIYCAALFATIALGNA